MTQRESNQDPSADRPVPRHELLRDQLRAGDPLAPGETMSSLPATRMRNAMLAEVRHTTPQRGWRLAAVAAALSVALGSAYLLRLSSDHPIPVNDGGVVAATGPSGSPSSTSDRADELNDRQIQFITRGGTRVIWLLKPKLDLEP